MISTIKHYIYILVTCLSIPLIAEVEYEFVQLPPAEYNEGSQAFVTIEDISENGYVIGRFSDHSTPKAPKGFIYHPDYGFKVIFDSSADYIIPEKVNNNGLVSGYISVKEWYVDAPDYYQTEYYPFTYDFHKDSFVSYRNLQNTSNTGAHIYGISNDGNALISLLGQHYNRNYIYNLSNQEVVLDLPYEEIYTDFESMWINNKGDIIGPTWFYSAEHQDFQNYGSLDPLGRWDTYVSAYNETGAVVGYGYDIQDEMKGFIWDQENGLAVIEHLGGEQIDCKSVNASGQVVGYSLTENLIQHAFIFERSRGITDLGSLGGEESKAYDINDLGQVVGLSHSHTNAKRAFIWDHTHGMRDLNDLIPSNTGWKKLKRATRINNKGYIVGEGKYNRQTRHFLLAPKKS